MSYIGATGLDENQEQFDILKDEIDANASYINNLVGIPDPLHTAVFGINILNPGLFGLVERAEVKIKLLETAEEGLGTDITGLTTQVEGIQTEVSGIQTEILGIQGEITGIDSTISSIEFIQLPALGTALTALIGATDVIAVDARNKANRALDIWDYSGDNVYHKKAGNVGIGTTFGSVLTNKLEVQGNINIPTGSTFRIGDEPFNYSHLAGEQPVSSKWTNATDVDTNIYYNSGNVGIGITTGIDNKMEVGGNLNISAGSKYKINNVNLAFSDLGGTLSYNSLSDKPTLFDGNYNSLTNKLTGGTNIQILNGAINNTYTLPTATTNDIGGVRPDGTTIFINNGVISSVGGTPQVNSDWTQTNTSLKSFIQNKPTAGTNISFAGNTITNIITGSPTQNIITLNDNYLIVKDKPDTQIVSEVDVPLTSGNEPTITSPAFTESVRVFTHSGGTEAQTTHTITIGQNTICDILVVGGGGGGGGSIAGGGGGGSVIYSTNITIPAGSYSILVGKGGNGGVNETDGSNGFNTIAFGATAVGGGRGGDYNVSNSESSGGSGGGEGGGANNGQGVGVAGLKGSNTIPNTSPLFTNYQYYVNDGGLAFYQNAANLNTTRGGGGGGAGTAGGAGGGNAIDTTTQGLGGDGIPISISGTAVYYGAGGGGGAHKGSNSQLLGKSGGLGGGGNGGNEFSNGTKTNGTDGTGYGAGGGGGSYLMNGGKGGSGIVIIKFRTIVNSAIPEGNPITHKTLNFAYDLTKYTEYQAQLKTGVGGWRIVRFLPPNLGRWYQGNYINTSTFTIPTIGTPYNYTNEWAVSFGTFDEMFFATFDMTYWLQCLKTSVLGDYADVARPVIKSSTRNYAHSVKWFNRAVTQFNQEDPWISINDHLTTPALMLYGENSNSTNHQSLLNTNGGMCVLVRDSTSGTTIPNPNQYTLSVQAGTSIQVNNQPAQYLSGNYTISVGATQSSVVKSGIGQVGSDPYPLTNGSTIAIRYSMLQRITSTINIKKDGLIKYVPASGTNPTTGTWNIIDLDTQPLTQFAGNLPANRLDNIDMSKVATGNLDWSRIASQPALSSLAGNLPLNRTDGNLPANRLDNIDMSKVATGNLHHSRVQDLYLGITNQFHRIIYAWENIVDTQGIWTNKFKINTNLHLNQYNQAYNYYQYFLSMSPNNVQDRHKYWFGTVKMSTIVGTDNTANTQWYLLRGDNNTFDIRGTSSTSGVWWLDIWTYTAAYCESLIAILH